MRRFWSVALLVALVVTTPSYAAEGELVDSIASGLAIFIIILVPVAGIAAFWMVHVLPEKFAEKRHHPQRDAIKVLCLLSLVFGGLLWPVAWLWAFTKPVFHKLAYGYDKHEDFYEEAGEPLPGDTSPRPTLGPPDPPPREQSTLHGERRPWKS